MLNRSLCSALLTLLALTVIGCRHRPGMDGIRTPVWVMGGTGVVHAERHRPDPTEPRHDLFLSTARDNERLLRRVVGAGLHPRAVSPDGRRLAVIAGTTAHPRLYVLSLPEGDRERLIRDVDLRPETLAWDPEGRRIAVSLQGEEAFLLLDADGGAVQRIPSQAPIVLGWLPFAPPTLLLATDRPAQDGNSVAVWSPAQPATAPQEIFRTVDAGRIKTAVMSPQGNRLAVIVSEAPRGHSLLHLVDLQTGEAPAIWDSPRPLTGLQWSPQGDALYISQLGREHTEGWILNRINIDTLRPEPLIEHRAGWGLSPDGRQMVIAPGNLQRLRVFDLQPRP